MRNLKLILVLSLFWSFSSIAQQTLKTKLAAFSANSFAQAIKFKDCAQSGYAEREQDQFKAGLHQMLQLRQNLNRPLKFLQNQDSLNLNDTLIIGAFPGDSVVISGSYFHNGPILILNDGYLGFDHATATILGDVFVAGPAARLEIDSSYMFFPQLYFYQRTLLLALNARLTIRNSTMDYSGLSHNLMATDNANVEMEQVTYVGFTTNGFYRNAAITMNGCNQAGEYVITDSCQLSFHDVSTLLLWHQVPSQASLSIEFPDGASVSHYQFQPGQAGVSGIHYTIDVTNSTEVWWALMPAGGSNVLVQNSDLRAIGLWFLGSDTVEVNGLVDNSTYANFTAGLNDRTLQLINSSVMTWSLYPMEKSYVKVQSCIVGEIGTMGSSRCDNIGVFADGSGGYVWATDTTFAMVGFSSLSSSVRSDRNGIMLLAYDAVTNGQVQAQGNSILMVLQSTLSEPPVLLDKACIWTAHLDPVQDAYAGLFIPITGTASINKTQSSNLMEFYAYRLSYQKSNDTNWFAIGPLALIEKEQDTLGIWNTNGLDPGSYVLKLILYDDTPDTNGVEVVRSVNLLPLFMGIQENNDAGEFRIYPNPAGDYLRVSSGTAITQPIRIFSIDGRMLLSTSYEPGGYVNVSSLEPGVYFLECTAEFSSRKIFVKL